MLRIRQFQTPAQHSIFKYISWLNGSFFGGDDRGFLKERVKTYLTTPMSQLDSPTFFLSFTSLVHGYFNFRTDFPNIPDALQRIILTQRQKKYRRPRQTTSSPTTAQTQHRRPREDTCDALANACPPAASFPPPAGGSRRRTGTPCSSPRPTPGAQSSCWPAGSRCGGAGSTARTGRTGPPAPVASRGRVTSRRTTGKGRGPSCPGRKASRSGRRGRMV